jgi:hypothetical protein
MNTCQACLCRDVHMTGVDVTMPRIVSRSRPSLTRSLHAATVATSAAQPARDAVARACA